MKCPYCQKPMREGYLHSGRDILWSPDSRWKLWSNLYVKTGGFILAKVGLGGFIGAKLPAHYCLSCQKVLLDIMSEKQIHITDIKNQD